jgi:hypothetical protein
MATWMTASDVSLRDRPTKALERRTTVGVLRAIAQRIQFLRTEVNQLQTEIDRLAGAIAPWLLELPGSDRSAPPRSW